MSSLEHQASNLGTGFSDQAVDVRRYSEALRHGVPLITAIAIVLTSVVIVLSLSLPKTYEASVQIVYNPTATLLQPTESTSIQRQLVTFQTLVQTPTVAGIAARELSESPTALRSSISASANSEANLITITATAREAATAAARANAVAKAFLTEEQSMQNLGLNNARAQLQEQIAKLQSVPGSAGQIAALQDRINELQINASGTTSELQIAESATAPSSPTSPRPTLDGLIALVASLLIGVLFVLGRDQLRPRFTVPRELGRALRLSVLAGIPYRRRFHSAHRLRALSGLEHEAYDALQATIRLLSAANGSQRILLITSATHGEGKTTATASLGRSLARVGQRTLLISGDLRSPTLHEHLGVPSAPGLADGLAAVNHGTQGPAETLKAMIRTAPGDLNLDVLPAGQIPSDPSSLMSGAALGLIFEVVRQLDYNYVLIDSPPLLGLGDTQLLAGHADDVLLVSRLDRITPEQAEDLRELLERLKLAPIGVVVVGAKVELSPYYLGERSLTTRS
jgi:succinoglycan biosynthesis transport protein ExoP